MRWTIGTAFMAAGLAACGGPILQGVPRPNPAAVAGIAAAAAAAATAANPSAAGRLQEQRNPSERQPTSGPREVVPLELLDKLDEADAHAAPTSAPASAPAGQTP